MLLNLAEMLETLVKVSDFVAIYICLCAAFMLRLTGCARSDHSGISTQLSLHPP